MPKSKHAPALFELYSKGSRDGGRLDDSSSYDADEGVSASSFRATIASVARTIGGANDPDREASDRPVGVAPPAIRVEDGRVHLALTSRAAGIAMFVLLVAGCLAYAAGTWSGRQTGVADGRDEAQKSFERVAVDDIERARRSRPIENLFAGIGASPVASQSSKPVAVPQAAPRSTLPLTAMRSDRSAGQTPWVKGHTYLVVQSFLGSARDDAVAAQEYLARHNVESEIFGGSDRGFRLIATSGFNRKDPTQRKLSDQFRSKVQSIGEAYSKTGGRYKLEGYFATLTADSW
ncbi:MAG: hypothetical protein H6817_09590 [Phycisphaerales bacterium]|nr:hypothetical protein [Phycisphaerales bacterium]